MAKNLPPEILCCGMFVADVLVQGVEELPPMGEVGFVPAITFATGGDAANQAKALHKLGNRVGVMGMVGNDLQGAMLSQQFKVIGLDTKGLVVDPTKPTHTAIVMIAKNGEHRFLIREPTPEVQTGPEHINLKLIKKGLKALTIGSMFCAPRLDLEALEPLLRKAKSVGAITLADMVMDQRHYGLKELKNVWPLLDFVAPSELEAELITGEKKPEAIAKAFQRHGVKNVLLKRGTNGVMAFMGSDVFTCPAFKVPVVDTTGAGDTFVGGFIHALIRGQDTAEALRFGSACAALSIGEVGAGAGLKNLQQVKAFLRKQKTWEKSLQA